MRKSRVNVTSIHNYGFYDREYTNGGHSTKNIVSDKSHQFFDGAPRLFTPSPTAPTNKNPTIISIGTVFINIT